MFFFTILNITIMADNTTGVTIAELTPTTALSSVDRKGGAYSITYANLVAQIDQSLGITELADALTNIIG